MKKSLVLVIAIFTIPLVEALTLFGEELSMLVLIPLIIILLFLLIFVFIIIKDKIKNKSSNPDTKLPIVPLPPSPGDLTKELPPLEEPPIEKPTTPESVKEKALPKEQPQKPKTDYYKELIELEKKLPSISIEDANKQLTELIKRFFSDYAKINYKFTFEELEKELKKRNKKITCFPKSFSSINYGPEGTSKGNLTELIKEFRGIIRFTEEESHPLTPQFKKEIEEKKKKIAHLLKKGEKSIGKDPNKAIEDYKKIFGLYNSLTDKEKADIRQSIMNFYNRLNL